MPRKKRSDEELNQASEHLYYEYWMFVTLANVQSTGAFGKGAINNALLEAFTIHTRSILDFLYRDESRDDDVLAIDFFDTPDEWISIRPEKSSTLQSIHKRVGKEVAHLTYTRQEISPEDKNWPFLEIANDVEAVFSEFLNLVPKDRLGPNWTEKMR
ncbi:MAG: hypothetical protein DRI65_15935 [Chloroflexota bacterium]|nr:MAG: hypothetical protein DRI65_15935 [Chloroflexota bacterium]HDD54633.1 hypothetical protein [Chloroflexota bacterium]